ncbi:PssD/Cps14F family polysaccharide biosynthesis glycosyltransferase [Vibrio parahaemolyticus]|uniref:Oligosaccharide biosynthesis Alg14 like family protein n=1 Tax=Vibrio parahaemolyticus TaxID=670 RepID=A0A5Q5AWW2_VIBPH|nr:MULTISPECIES: PssD/Cps14F family polysaccharide biosynthesis glycosyltransferase [Vibrio harveyi group]EGR1172476.1 polysaccharide biosynthesis protein [Vibrio parahaemolyticus]EJG0223787.1 polysaccharide biosynthesis protein [Vibrio parahaemolyticus]EJG0347815.1 polysaccharide biosynthesis protein [Vibrio parahaemolyticus]EJG0552752.1 polysaccharide biosynthesis protein [Vibrio parahaemolyticus]EJG1727453.1 polysaccharide biosynthesis protein [Vibrio parahaemolyticus]
MSNLVAFVAGQGGHFSQFERLYRHYVNHDVDCTNLLITDELKPGCSFEGRAIEVGELRPKKGFSFTSLYHHLIRCIDVAREFKKYDRITLISTGPGIALSCSLLAKIYGGKVIHIETWSRFYNKSFTGRFIYYLADHFYVQNSELLAIYPKAKYSGRL